MRGIREVIARSRLKVEAVEKVASEGGGVGKDRLLSVSSSHMFIYFTGCVNLVLDCVLWQGFLVIDFIHDFQV